MRLDAENRLELENLAQPPNEAPFDLRRSIAKKVETVTFR